MSKATLSTWYSSLRNAISRSFVAGFFCAGYSVFFFYIQGFSNCFGDIVTPPAQGLHPFSQDSYLLMRFIHTVFGKIFLNGGKFIPDIEVSFNLKGYAKRFCLFFQPVGSHAGWSRWLSEYQIHSTDRWSGYPQIQNKAGHRFEAICRHCYNARH